MKHLKHIIIAGIAVFALAAALVAGDDTEKAEGIQWVSYDVGLEQAADENKHVFIDFTAKWCGYCKKMDRETFSRADVIDLINDNFVPVKVNGDSQKELDIDGYKITEAGLAKQEFGVRGYPTFWFLKSDGTKLGAVTGYKPAAQMIEFLTFVKDEKYDTTKVDTPEAEGGK